MTATTINPTGQAIAQRGDEPGPQRWEALADRLQAVADPTRLRLLAALQAMPHNGGCVSEITTATGLAQPTVSHHLQILHRAALLHRTRLGSRTYYQISNEALEAVARDLTTPHPL